MPELIKFRDSHDKKSCYCSIISQPLLRPSEDTEFFKHLEERLCSDLKWVIIDGDFTTEDELRTLCMFIKEFGYRVRVVTENTDLNLVRGLMNSGYVDSITIGK